MNNDIYLIGEVGYEITLQNTIDLVNQSDKKKPLNVHIHSQGGGVYDGLAIYNYLKGLPQQVNTKSAGLVASIASIIFLAGDKSTRSINSTDNFLIHLPSGMNWGNAKDLEKTAEELREIETKLSNIYENETSLTASEALEMMKEDKFLDVNLLKDKGFVNEIIEFKAVAKFGNKENNLNNDMSEQLTKKEALGWFEKLENLLKSPKDKAPDNKIVQDANGVEIDFYNLEPSAEIGENAEAKIEGKKAEGEYTMPSGQIFKFENGILTTITKVAEPNAELVALQSEFDDFKNEKETEITNLKNELETKDNLVAEIQNEFKELKNTVTSNFEHENKTEAPKKEEAKTESRTSFKSKYKN